jgi:hypothetical protein
MSNDWSSIDCPNHGKGTASVVCCHLLENKKYPLGFVENSSDPGDLQGWCFACEFLYELEKDKTEKFRIFNDMKVVCEKCYGELKQKNQFDI